MPRNVDTYRHLDETEPLRMTFTIEDLAERIEATNYGVHRFLSAVIRIRRKKYAETGYACHKQMADALETLLDSGAY
jgi:hypothetical protein